MFRLPIVQNVIGFFIGENSHKREIGVAMIAIFSILFQIDYFTVDQYEALMGFALVWTGWAQNLRVKKLQKAMIAAKG